MNLRALSDEELLTNTERAAADERAATTRLLHHLSEVERRRLFAKRACSSLFDYCVKILKMSQPQASRRVNASRLLREFPAIEQKIEGGNLTVSNLSQAQAFFRKEKSSVDDKKEILKRIEGQSARNTEKILIGFAKDPIKHRPSSIRPVGDGISQLTCPLDEETLANIEWLQQHWSHSIPNGNLSEVISRATKFCRDKLDRKARRQPGDQTITEVQGDGELRAVINPTPTSKWRRTRYVPADVRRKVWARDGECCTYIDYETGRQCGSKHQLQLDHIIPYALGGTNTEDNLRLRCFAHNQWHAIETFGKKVWEYTNST